MIGLRILDNCENVLKEFLPIEGCDQEAFTNISLTTKIESVGSGTFTATPGIAIYAQPGNLVQFFDTDNGDQAVYTGMVQPYTMGKTGTVNVTEYKDILNYQYFKSDGVLTNLNELNNLFNYTFVDCSGATYSIEYKCGQSVYSLLDEVAEFANVNWTFDGEVRMGCSQVRNDIEFYNSGNLDCATTGGVIPITNIQRNFPKYWNRVIAKNNNGNTVILPSYTGGETEKYIETVKSFDADNISDLTVQANNYLSEGKW